MRGHLRIPHRLAYGSSIWESSSFSENNLWLTVAVVLSDQILLSLRPCFTPLCPHYFVPHKDHIARQRINFRVRARKCVGVPCIKRRAILHLETLAWLERPCTLFPTSIAQ